MKMSGLVYQSCPIPVTCTDPKFNRMRQLSGVIEECLGIPKKSLAQLSWCRIVVSVFVVSAIFAGAPELALSASPEKLPALTEVMDYVDQHFAKTPKYRPGDIISTSYVTALFEGLEKLGWNVPDQKALLKLVPSDKNYVVQQLRTEPGRKFMQQICNFPLGYDRLFHLSKIPMGERQVYALIRAKEGYKLIEYMTTTPYGNNLGKQLSNSPHGANFNKATGQIYTVEELKSELEKSYQATQQALAKAAQ